MIKYHSILNSAPIIDILQIKIQHFLKKKDNPGTYPQEKKLSRKKVQFMGQTIPKDNPTYGAEIGTYICSLGEISYRRKTKNRKQRKNNFWTNKYKNFIMKEYCLKNKNYRIIKYYENLSTIRMQRKMETNWSQKIY